MRAKWLKFGAVAFAALMSVSTLAACEGNPGILPTIDPTTDTYEWTYGKESVEDTSDIPSWEEGLRQLNLVAWNANGTGQFTAYKSSDDVVSAEIKRVTGVSIDTKNSFDNAGQTIEAALSSVIMSPNKPDIAYGTHEMSQIINSGDHALVYDLTEYIDKYCPTIKARMPESVWNSASVNGGEEGKVYGIPFNLGDVGLSTVDPTADPQKTIAFEYLQNYYGCVYVRDDILTALYPEAHTYEELQQIYQENGTFTTEELYDVSITSAQEFYDFLYDIAEYVDADIAENGTDSRYSMPQGRKVMPILARDGSDRDNWSLMAGLFPILLGANGYLNTMFSYWDATEHKVQNMLLQSWFEDMLEDWNGFVQEGVICNDYGLRTPYSTIQNEMNSGYYAVAYPNCTPNNNTATLPNGETVHYRKVWLQIDLADQFEFFAQSAPVPSSVVIFKDSVAEEDIPQILRWLDYQCSTIADKLYAWGPESAGLFTETDGVRQFKDEELANQMVYETAKMGDLVQKYNLSNTTLASAQPTFPFFYQGGSKYHPKCVYDLGKMPEMMDSFYSPAAVDPNNNDKLVNIARRADIYTWSEGDLAGVTTVWAKRATIEKAISDVLLAKDGMFSTAYSNLVRTCQMNGWSDEYFAGEYTEVFLALNKDYLGNFQKGVD